MKDDFDKLPPDDEDDSLDWLRNDSSDDDKPSGSGDNLNTGDLEWRKDVADAFDKQLNQTDNDDLFDWQKGQSSSTSSSGKSSSGFGLTGKLDWQNAQPEESGGVSGGDDDSLDWLNASEPEPTVPSSPTEQMPDMTSAEDGDPLGWLKEYGDDMLSDEQPPDEPIVDEPYEEMPEPEVDPLAWMKQYQDDDDGDADEPEPADVPDWLDDMQPESSTEDGDDDLPSPTGPLSWLKQYAPPEELEKAGVSPPHSDDEESTEWLENDDLFDVPNAQAPAGAVEDASPDWLRGDDFPAQPEPEPEPAASEEFPDWLSAMNEVEPVAADDEDLFGGLDEALGLGGAAPVDDGVPDWLKAAAPGKPPAAQPPPPAQPPADIFAELGMSDVQTGYEFLDKPEQPAASTGGDDWFAEFDEAPTDDADAVPNWLTDLGDAQEQEPEPQAEIPKADDDFLADLLGDAAPVDAEPTFDDFDDFEARGLQDIDKLLESYHDMAPAAPADAAESDIDFDALLSDDDRVQINTRRGSGDAKPRVPITGLSPDAPDWLTEIGASVGSVDEVSAAAIVRKRSQKEKSLDDLSDRLYALHEAGMEVNDAPDTATPDVIQALLPGVSQVLPAAPIKAGLPSIAAQLALSDAQRDKIRLLKGLVAIDDDDQPRPAPRSAIDATLDTPSFSDILRLEGDEDALPEVKAPPIERTVTRPRLRVKVGRLLMALSIAAAVILPFFVSSLRLGNLPPASFAAGSRAALAYSQVDALQPGDLALVAAEYGPTGAGELDSTLDALLRHILMRGAKPVLVSGDAVGLLHAQNLLARLVADPVFLGAINHPTPLVANRDYFVIRYLVGEAVGLRTFSGDVASILATDINGNASGLSVSSIKDFGLVAVIAERAETARAWAEQVAPLTAQPIVMATGFSAAPLVEPYAMAGAPGAIGGVGGTLVGYRDAYTYRTMLDVAMGLRPEVVVPTQQPTTAAPSTDATLPPDLGTGVPDVLATLGTGVSDVLGTLGTGVPDVQGTLGALGTGAPDVQGTLDALGTAGPDALGTLGTGLPDVGSVQSTANAELTRISVTINAVTTATAGALSAPTEIVATEAPATQVAPTQEPTQKPTTAAPTVGATNTPTPRPPTITPTPSPTPGTGVRAVINSSQGVNVREGPGTGFAPIATASPGTIVEVIGRNADESWIKIRLEDGREGWVAAALILIEEPTVEASPTREGAYIDPNAVVGLDTDIVGRGSFTNLPLQAQPEATEESTTEATAEVTAEATVEPTLNPTLPPTSAPSQPISIAATERYRDERWYGMTLGLAVIIVMIAISAVVNILRGLFRRNKA